MYIIIGILSVLILILIICLWNYQRQIRDICRQLAFLKENDSNLMITRQFDWGGIGALTDILNEFLVMRKEERKSYLEKEKVISDTYTNLSHDIRTPLTSLDGYFQLLEQSETPEEQKRYFMIIRERIGSLKDMLEELFTFTKLKNDSYRLELSSCCVSRILKDTIFSYYEEWTRRGITPDIHITEERLYMQGNVQALRRILQNVIKNGMDHGECQIGIWLEKKEDQIRISIWNEVKEPEQIDVTQVFERFYKADEARSKTSTGLGLSIAKELILRMNGSVEVKIEGNRFCVEMEFPSIECKGREEIHALASQAGE